MTTLVPKYYQGSANSVNRAFNLKLAETVSVQDFGADPTGTSDSTNAFNYALATGNDVYVPNGNYKITSTLTMNTGFQVMYGAGRGASILNFSFASGGGIGISVTHVVSTVNAGNQTIRDLSINTSSNCSKLIDILAPQVNIWNCYLSNASANGTIIYGEDENTGSGIYVFASKILNNTIHKIGRAHV